MQNPKPQPSPPIEIGVKPGMVDSWWKALALMVPAVLILAAATVFAWFELIPWAAGVVKAALGR